MMNLRSIGISSQLLVCSDQIKSSILRAIGAFKVKIINVFLYENHKLLR